MMVEAAELTQVTGWAGGLERLHSRIALPFCASRAETRGHWPISKGCSVPLNARMEGLSPSKQGKGDPMASNACSTPPGGMLMACVLICGPTLSSILGTREPWR